jgi:hypothetical protein
MTRTLTLLVSLLLSFATQQSPPPQPASPIPATHLQTRWAAQVTPDNVLPEYPRPQMKRKNWMNLNGTWNYAITDAAADRPPSFDGKILVPFPIESQLSGVGVWVSPQQRLWYRRTFKAPAVGTGRLLLNFGAVDWEAVIYVNGQRVGEHRGGYDPFMFDITDHLKKDAEQELVVAVRDPTDDGEQPRGKQVRRPRGIYYTEVTGIWQTVWLEAVAAWHVTGLRIDPDLDRGAVRVSVGTEGRTQQGGGIDVSVLDGEREVVRGAGPTVTLDVKNPHRWSPSDPFLYTLRVRLDSGDEVDSYFGMRSIAVRRDASGLSRLFLNGEPLFEFGLLDQGWWPDGLYTAPTDEALAFDIQKTKELGFNTIRKHVKVEPARWYYDADRLGVLVWQDMPSGNNQGPEAQANFNRELQNVIDTLRNHPCIVMWVPFNEGWGQHATEQYVSWLKSYDPTRLVNNASGWTDAKVGDVADLHAYPGPAKPPPWGRAAMLGEFGGLGLPIESHTWLERGNWGYRSYTNLDDLNAAFRDLLSQLRLHIGDGLASAIYTQTTDVEIEVNGVMTYDRAVTKLSPETIAAIRRIYEPAPVIRHVVEASDRSQATWRYTTTSPAANWFDPAFDDASWKSGASAFGARDTRYANVGTEWNTSDIWLRRVVDLPAGPLSAPYLRIFHDDDAQVYLNGKLIAELPGANAGFAYVPLSVEARAVLHPGKNTLAIHAHQVRGGQFIDAGLAEVIAR